MSEDEVPYTLDDQTPAPVRLLRHALRGVQDGIEAARSRITRCQTEIAEGEKQAEELQAAIAKLEQDAR